MQADGLDAHALGFRKPIEQGLAEADLLVLSRHYVRDSSQNTPRAPGMFCPITRVVRGLVT